MKRVSWTWAAKGVLWHFGYVAHFGCAACPAPKPRRGLDEVPLRGTSIPYPSKAFFMKRDLRADALSAWWAAQFSLARDRTAHVQRPVAQQNGALKRRVSCPQAFQRRETIRVTRFPVFSPAAAVFARFSHTHLTRFTGARTHMAPSLPYLAAYPAAPHIPHLTPSGFLASDEPTSVTSYDDVRAHAHGYQSVSIQAPSRSCVCM